MISNLNGLSARLQELEALEGQRDRSNGSRLYAGGVMAELVSPLEALNNLLFLLQLCPDNPEKNAIYVDMAQDEALRLNEIARRTLSFCHSDQLPNNEAR